jgi:glycosyltransferase involved in cell wall biosynthesis
VEKITFCIPSKSNLRYLKTCISSIRENAYRKDHDIIIFVDSDEDGTIEWLDQVKDTYNISYFVNPNLGKSLFGIGKAYDYCIDHSNTDIFMIFHADMMLGKDADLKAYNHLKENTVVCATRIEPPIHPNAGEKILMDFGMWPEEFDQGSFDEFVQLHRHNDKITNGIFAPWMMYKKDFLALGGHDPILKSCREDSDVFNRMKLAGYTFIQSWNSLVYHLTGRGAGSFDGDQLRHEAWKQEMHNSTKEFIRKWGSNVKHTDLMMPIVPPKYNIGFIIHNCTDQLLNVLEPWCNDVYIDMSPDRYIWQEQPNTKSDLVSRIHDITMRSDNDILVHIDGRRFTNDDFYIVQELASIIQQTDDIGEFTIGNLTINIKLLATYENDLITCHDNIYNK